MYSVSPMKPPDPKQPFRRRVRYQGTHPRGFSEKYKEFAAESNPETIAKIIASGKTPAGQHRAILVDEVLEFLAPEPGERGADVTLGYGGHSEALLNKLHPGGRLLALDVDAEQLPRTEMRLRDLGFDEEALIARRCNYTELTDTLNKIGWTDAVDFLLADLGLSSMQIDNPARGFSYKYDGPLDMRMNPESAVSARDWLLQCKIKTLADVLIEGGDEPHAEQLARTIITATRKSPIETTRQLRDLIEAAVPVLDDEERKATVTRVFQAIRIEINHEFKALDSFLEQLPGCVRPGGRIAILSFHSGEDRRVKQHFREGLRVGDYSEVARRVIRPGYREIGGNPRASSAKMRWAIRTGEM
jgi:16S rRNA (cytosine1402-N4)-methyltransferase